MPPLNRPRGESRWRRREEFVPTPPAPNARIVIPEPDPPLPAVTVADDSWFDEVDRVVDGLTGSITVDTASLGAREAIDRWAEATGTPAAELIATTHDEVTISVPEEVPRTASGFISPGDRTRFSERQRDFMIRYDGRWIVPTPQAREVTVEFDETSTRIQSRAVERPRGYWKLRNGKFVEIREMDDNHLENCIRMCERNSQARGRRADPDTPGVYSELYQERIRRGIARERMAERLQFVARQALEVMQWRGLQPIESEEIRNGGMVVQASNADRTPIQGSMYAGIDRTAPVPEESRQVPGAIPEGAPKRRIKI